MMAEPYDFPIATNRDKAQSLDRTRLYVGGDRGRLDMRAYAECRLTSWPSRSSGCTALHRAFIDADSPDDGAIHQMTLGRA